MHGLARLGSNSKCACVCVCAAQEAALAEPDLALVGEMVALLDSAITLAYTGTAGQYSVLPHLRNPSGQCAPFGGRA